MNAPFLDCLHEEARAHVARLKADLETGCRLQLALAFCLESLHDSHAKLRLQAMTPTDSNPKRFALSACKIALRSLDDKAAWSGICDAGKEAFRNKLLESVRWLTDL